MMESRRSAVAALFLLLIPAAAGQSQAEAVFTHSGPSSLAGDVHGECDARGLILPNVPSEFEVSGGVLEERVTVVNRTGGTSFEWERPERQRSERTDIVAGLVRLEPAASGLLVGLVPGFPSSRADPFLVEWSATNASRDAFVDGDRLSTEHVWLEGSVQPVLSPLRFSGPTHRLEHDGSSTARGSMTVYVREAAIRSDALERRAQPYETVAFQAGTAQVEHRTIEIRDAFLRVDVVHWNVPPATVLVCGPSKIHVDGSFVVANATGILRTADREESFTGRALSLLGSFDVQEEIEQGTPSVRAAGDIRSASVDFVPTRDWATASWAAAGSITLVAAALAILLKFAGSITGLFYSRYGRDRVLDNPNRDIVYEAVRGDPGLELARLAERTSLHRATVAYHVRVLRRVGLVSTVRRGKAVHVLEPRLMNAQDLPRVLASRNDSVAILTEILKEGERPLKDIVGILVERCAITDRAAYLIARRAVARGAALRFVRDGEVRLACADS